MRSVIRVVSFVVLGECVLFVSTGDKIYQTFL